MKYFIETAVSAIAVVGFLWQIAKGYQAIYEAIDQKNDMLSHRIFELEKQLEIHEVECSESLKRIELLVSKLVTSQASRYPLL
jgi:hypothetical protein